MLLISCMNKFAGCNCSFCIHRKSGTWKVFFILLMNAVTEKKSVVSKWHPLAIDSNDAAINSIARWIINCIKHGNWQVIHKLKNLFASFNHVLQFCKCLTQPKSLIKLTFKLTTCISIWSSLLSHMPVPQSIAQYATKTASSDTYLVNMESPRIVYLGWCAPIPAECFWKITWAKKIHNSASEQLQLPRCKCCIPNKILSLCHCSVYSAVMFLNQSGFTSLLFYEFSLHVFYLT